MNEEQAQALAQVARRDQEHAAFVELKLGRMRETYLTDPMDQPVPGEPLQRASQENP